MNNLYKLIDEQLDARAVALEKCLYYHNLGMYKTAKDYHDRARRITLHIKELEEELNNPTKEGFVKINPNDFQIG